MINSKRLIVNADDLGALEYINDAVLKAFQNGICRSASIMAGGITFDEAVNIARENKNLSIGVHFTLVRGTPVMPPSEIPSLVDRNTGKPEVIS